MIGVLNHYIRFYRGAIAVGMMFGFAGTTAFFSVAASKYKQRADHLATERQAIDHTLVRIEKSLVDINRFRDNIDSLTTTTVGRDSLSVDDVNSHLAKVRMGLKDQNRFSSVDERINNNRNRLAEVAAQTAQTAQTLRAVSTIMSLRKDILDGVPSITPATGWISSTFGERKSPFSGEEVVHKGLDIGAELGTPIYASADGVVEMVMKSDSFGNLLVIKHAADIETKYAHTQEIYVKQGQAVRRGDLIAAVGSTGRSTGPHLHYEVHLASKPVNPLDYLLDHQISDDTMLPNFAMDSVGGEDLSDKAISPRVSNLEISAPLAAVASPAHASFAKAQSINWAIASLIILISFVFLYRAVVAAKPKPINWQLQFPQ